MMNTENAVQLGETQHADAQAGADAQPCIVFTGGGTGGHIYPGLAVIDELRRLGFTGRIVWIGSEKELDRSIVASHGIEYFAIPSGKFRREISFRNLTDLGRIAAGYFKAKALLKKLHPVLLFSKGGYVSVPPCRAAAALGIPVFTHESDASPGLATRLNSVHAERILTSWEDTARYFPQSLRSRIIRTGNPTRPDLFEGDRARGLKLLGFSDDRPVLFVLGGSQGAQEVNRLVLSSLSGLCPAVQIVHQTGQAHYEDVVHAMPDDPSIRAAYRPLAYIGAEIADIYAASDMVAGRAGAGTIWEAASLGKPMILIPLSGTGTRGDQVENAALASKIGAAIVLEGDKATPEAFIAAVRSLLNPEVYSAAAKACRTLAQVTHDVEVPNMQSLDAANSIATTGSHYATEFIARFILARIGWRAKETQ